MKDKIAFLVPTRGRPSNVGALALAWDEMIGAGFADLIFIVDGDHPEEHDYVRKSNGHQVYFQPWRGLSATLNTQALHFAERYQYVGFMGDDHRPRTKYFDQKLIIDLDYAGPYAVLYGPDGQPGWTAENQDSYAVDALTSHAPMTWWAMDSRLIRLLGQMVPWPLSHTCVDDYVWQLGYQAHKLWYSPSVLMEHLHPLWGKGSMDESYERSSEHNNRLADHKKWETYQEVQLPRDVRLIRSALNKT